MWPPTHPSIKFIASALEKTLDNPDIHLYCDVEFGKDVTLDDLLARYDAVLFATGAVKDKPLNLPGADLEGVYGAAKFVECTTDTHRCPRMPLRPRTSP